MTVSNETRMRMSKAQKARWARVRAEQEIDLPSSYYTKPVSLSVYHRRLKSTQKTSPKIRERVLRHYAEFGEVLRNNLPENSRRKEILRNYGRLFNEISMCLASGPKV